METSELRSVLTEESLFAAWETISAKNAAPGIDDVWVSDFGKNPREYIRDILKKIYLSQYTPKPVAVFFKPKKDDSLRELCIPTIADKIVAKAIADYLQTKYNCIMSPYSYAYRVKKGPSRAVMVTEKAILTKRYTHVARIDIQDFFPSMDKRLIIDNFIKLGETDELIELIMKFVNNQKFDGVSLVQDKTGVLQGIPLAPFISNLYLNSFDHLLSELNFNFLRFADDIIVLAEDSNRANEAMSTVYRLLGDINLSPNIDKSRIYTVESGFTFLGFFFNQLGKVPCAEAQSRLESFKQTEKYCDETDKEFQTRRDSIIRGWRNYYEPKNGFEEGNPEAEHMFETENSIREATISKGDVCLSGATNVIEQEISIASDNKNRYDEESFNNYSSEINEHVSDISSRMDEIQIMIDSERNTQGINLIRRTLNTEEYELDNHQRVELHKKLAMLYERQGVLGARDSCLHAVGLNTKSIEYNKKVEFGTNDLQEWLKLFGSSEGKLYKQYVDRLGRMGFRPAISKLTPKDMKEHWEFRHTLAAPIFIDKNTVHFGVIDLDISRKELDSQNTEQLEIIKENLLADAINIVALAHEQGIEAILEDSGYKGYHIWFLFFTPISASLVKSFLLSLNKYAGKPPEGTHRELFPASSTKNQDGIGSIIKIPLGYHRLSKKESVILSPDGRKALNGLQMFSNYRLRIKPSKLKSAINSWEHYSSKSSNSIGNRSETLNGLYNGCSILRALRQKAQETKKLNHQERVVIRGILAPLGDLGLREIHSIIKHCDNYSRQITDKMTASLPGKPRRPIGCRRIKEILNSLCSQVNCNCSFRPKKNDYANPLRHISKLKDEEKRAKTDKHHFINNETPTTLVNDCIDYSQNYNDELNSNTNLPQELLQLMNQFHQLRDQLLDVQKELISQMGDKSEVDIGFGKIQKRGNDPDILNWNIKL